MLRQAMLNNCKDKGCKGLPFSQQKGKIMKNSRVGIFIKQHMDQVQTSVNTGNVVLPRNRRWKPVNYDMHIAAQIPWDSVDLDPVLSLTLSMSEENVL